MNKRSFWLTGRKRTLWVALSMVLISMLILVACGETTATTTAPTPAPTVAPPTPTPTQAPATQSTTVVVVEMLENPPGHYFFQPSSLTITAGTTVVWFDASDAPHTVTSDANAPSAFGTTSNVTQGKSFALVFNTPGTYTYHCNIHPNMKANIKVTAAS
ncbi:MAG TPA: plastocyanin/azurin family copper-binding protein [Ktedonobacteraceae bacterium]